MKKRIKSVELKETTVTDSKGSLLQAEMTLTLEKAPIGRISEDMGREDLNQLARKINELIEYVSTK